MAVGFNEILRYIFIVFWVLCLAAFIWRRKHPAISNRGLYPALLQSCGFLIEFITVSVLVTTGGTCALYFIPIVLSVPLWGFPYFSRVALITWYNYCFSEEKMIFGHQLSKQTSYFYQRKFLISQTFQIFLHVGLLMAVIIPTLAVYYSSDYLPGHHEADEFKTACPGYQTIYFISVEVALLCFLILLTTIKLWRVHDPYKLKLELKLALIVAFVGFPFYVVASLGLLPKEIGPLAIYLIFFSLMGISFVMPIVLTFLKQSYYIRRTSSSNSIDKTSFAEYKMIFEDPNLLISFSNFCVEKWCSENLIFIQELQIYKSLSEGERLRKAKAMKENFLDESGPMLLNLGGKTRAVVLERIAGGEAGLDLFQQVEKEVEEFLYYGVFLSWLDHRGAAGLQKEPQRSFEINLQVAE